MERTRDSATSLPPELYLRQFRDADVDDPESLAEIARLGGPMIPTTYQYVDELPHRELAFAGSAAEWYEHLATWWTDRGHEAPAGLSERGHQPSGRGRTDGRIVCSVHAAEIAYRVWAVQRLTDHALAYVRGEDVDAAWGWPGPTRALGPWVPPAGKAGPLVPAWVKESPPGHEAWRRFCAITASALRDIHVRAEVSFGDDQEWDVGQPSQGVTVYTVAVLQLVNDLTIQATYRECANEACGRSFVRQLGRGDRYRMEGVVRYCSRMCANEQTQRDYRRRKRVERQTGERSS